MDKPEHKLDASDGGCTDCGLPRICKPDDPRYVEGCRPSWPEIWMEFARSIARRSHDPRLQVGAVLVSEDNTSVLAVGYNGREKGGPNVVESLEPGQSGTVHAEQNCLIKAPFYHPRKKHMYLTHSPCRPCAKLIINAEVSVVVYEKLYRDESGLELLRNAGIEVMSVEAAILMAKR